MPLLFFPIYTIYMLYLSIRHLYIDFFMNSFWCELDGENLRKKAHRAPGTQQNQRNSTGFKGGHIIIKGNDFYTLA